MPLQSPSNLQGRKDVFLPASLPGLGWAPLLLLAPLILLFREAVPPWAFMWGTAFALFVGFKWMTWWQASGPDAKASRSLAYLFLWPGMDAVRFLDDQASPPPPFRLAWAGALLKTLLGVGLIWGAAPQVENQFGAAWIAMVGLVFLLHFGLFHLLALFWQQRGIDARPLMTFPLAAISVSEFWGKRWNAGFRDIVFGPLFWRVAKRWGPRRATLVVFLVSGLLHEIVITLPARGGYGGPTLYFLLQGLATVLEHSRSGRFFGLKQSWRGRLFTFATVLLPIGWVYPPLFVHRVMIPFFHLIGAFS